MEKKYELLKDDSMINRFFTDGENTILYRIKALRDFGNVKAGDLGGYIQSEDNLSHEGTCWVYDEAKVWDHAIIRDRTRVHDEAYVYGNAKVYDDAYICNNARIYDEVELHGCIKVCDAVRICGFAKVYGFVALYDHSVVCDNARVYNASIRNSAMICSNAVIKRTSDYSVISQFGSVYRTTTFFRCEDNLIRVSCGCFTGTLEEFRERVNETRTGKIAEEYLMIADLMEKHFS